MMVCGRRLICARIKAEYMQGTMPQNDVPSNQIADMRVSSRRQPDIRQPNPATNPCLFLCLGAGTLRNSGRLLIDRLTQLVPRTYLLFFFFFSRLWRPHPSLHAGVEEARMCVDPYLPIFDSTALRSSSLTVFLSG
jgi:hypothetical protein